MNIFERLEGLPEETEFKAEYNPRVSFTKEQIKSYLLNLLSIIPDLKDRPGFIDPAPGVVIPSDGIILATNYPYGHHRCLRVLWIEDNGKKGERCCYVTSAFFSKGKCWNAPKKGTYFVQAIPYFMFDADKHPEVHTYSYASNGASYDYDKKKYTFFPENITAFLATNGERLSERSKDLLNRYIVFLTKKKEQAQAQEAQTAQA